MHFFRLAPLFLVSSLSSLYLVSAQESQSSSSPQYTSDTAFRDTILNVTNTYRAQHNATELVWNETLAAAAQAWSAKCEFEHSGAPSGENLAAGYPNVSTSIDVWAGERAKYNFRNAEYDTSTGHFTQLVWKATKSVGCGRAECNGGEEGGKGDAPGWFLVCEYWPGGNVIGRFGDNVQAQMKTGAAAGRMRGSMWFLGVVVLGVSVGVGW